MLRRAIPLIIFCIAACLGAAGQKKATVIAPSYAWSMLPPLGLHESATIDTLLFDYSMESVPSAVSPAWVSTGNLGSPGINMILADRPAMSDFYFRDAIRHWIPMQGNHKFYNTRIPMTLVSYNTSGGRETAQDRLQADFSGNVNSRLQFGASVDYLYSKGSYANQADKNLAWGLSSSYMGDRYELQTFINHYNLVAKENGGITDDLYITNPEVLQGGSAKIDAKSIPTFLTGAHSRVTGSEFMANSRYKVGYWHVTPPNDSIPGDTIEHRTYIPVSSFIWTLDYNKAAMCLTTLCLRRRRISGAIRICRTGTLTTIHRTGRFLTLSVCRFSKVSTSMRKRVWRHMSLMRSGVTIRPSTAFR